LKLIKHYGLLLKRYTGLRERISHSLFNVGPVAVRKPYHIRKKMMSLTAVLFASLSARVCLKLFTTIQARYFDFWFPFRVIRSGMKFVMDMGHGATAGTILLNIRHRTAHGKLFAAMLTGYGYMRALFVDLLAPVSGIYAILGTKLGMISKLRTYLIPLSALPANLSDNVHSFSKKVIPSGAASGVQADPISHRGPWEKEKNAVIGYVCLNSKDYITR
jgi:hypothetical protein